MHVLPRVAELHERFSSELVVIGVHAGKYPAERVTEHIRSACGRLDVRHPVVNDRQFRIWREYAVEAWPTVVVVSPDGYVIGRHAGEFAVEEMAGVIAQAVATADEKGLLDRTPFEAGADPRALPEPPGPLRYPGRLMVDGDRLYVSDSGHHRVLELRLPGGVDARDGAGHVVAVLERAFGGGSPGLADGTLEHAAFNEPQGLALDGGTLWVADRRNHAVRSIRLSDGEVRTVAGTGDLGFRAIGQGPALETSLRSPWDLTLAGGLLYVAMAGSHQIWRLDPARGTLALHAGSGGEAIVDGPGASALLAQPMGIAASGGTLAFCDAESSAVRTCGTDERALVRTVVGTGLFDFGDRDGTGETALLQHAESLAWLGDGLVVADTYNDKLKLVDPVTRACSAFPGPAGSGEEFHHPAGVATGGGRVWVADTGAHRIVVVDPETGAVSELAIG
jgi:DNA-binding beta-propeller fold protein YncE